jgi:hypothetical protein
MNKKTISISVLIRVARSGLAHRNQQASTTPTTKARSGGT